MSNASINEIGTRGLVVFKDDKYYFVTEKDWRNKGPLSDAAANLPLPELDRVKAVVAELDNVVFVDLNKLHNLDDASVATPPTSIAWSKSDLSIVLREDNNFFQVALDEDDTIDDGFEGDARVLVNRGAVVAAIPQNTIPTGSYCVLLNLSSLLG